MKSDRGYRVLTRRSADYPALLAAIHDPPRRLYLRGDGSPRLLSCPAVAIVGTRSCSPYGAQVARRLGRELAAAGAVVVSGLARGIDAEAHRGALEGEGATVAVLGCGIDRDYPRAHSALAQTDRRQRPARLGVRARRRAGALALPGSQPHHRRAGRGNGHRRGAGAQRRPDHRRLRARGRVARSSPSRARSPRRSRAARTSCCALAPRPSSSRRT